MIRCDFTASFFKHFLLTSILFAMVMVSVGCSSGYSSVTCSVPSGETLELHALSPSAKNGQLETPRSTAWFSFDEKAFTAILSRDPSLDSIEITVKNETSVPLSISLAPVFKKDITARGKLVKNPEVRTLSRVEQVAGTLSIRMKMVSPESENSLIGFAIECACDNPGSEAYAVITDVRLCSQEIGWDTAHSSYWVGFDAHGGTRSYGEKGPVELPHKGSAVFSFLESTHDTNSPAQQNRSVFSTGKTQFGWRSSPIVHTARVYAEQLSQIPATITPVSGTELLSGIRIEPGSLIHRLKDTRTPIPVDPNAMITWPQTAWRNKNREVFAWDRFPSILIFDTADYAVQAQYFKRLAFFAEKNGFRGKLMQDKDIAHLHGYNAHDYGAESLAAFFDVAFREHFPLNSQEEDLRAILLEQGIIIQGDEGFIPGEGAVLSFSRQSSTSLRYLFVAHESFHGLYFTHPEYRAEMHRLYTSMDARAVDFLESYFTVIKSLGYDRSDQFLMENECMAYTLQQSLGRVSPYFSGTLHERFLRHGGSPVLAEYIDETKAADFVALAQALESYVYGKWGIAGGRVGLWYTRAAQ